MAKVKDHQKVPKHVWDQRNIHSLLLNTLPMRSVPTVRFLKVKRKRGSWYLQQGDENCCV